MKTDPADHGAGAGALADGPAHRDRRRRGAAVRRACSRSSATATSPASREALEAVKDELPTWRGQNEQSMALAAIGFAKAKKRRQIMVARSLDRPGRHQHGHRRRRRARQPPAGPAPRRRHLRQPPARPGAAAGRALRQSDHHASTTPSRPVTRYWDRITPARADHLRRCRRRSRPCSTRPTAARPSSASARTRRREAFDYPERVLRADASTASRAPRPDARASSRAAAALLRKAKKPLHHRRRRRALLAWPRRRSPRSPTTPRHPGGRDHRRRAPCCSTTIRMQRRPDRRASARPRPTRSPPRPTWCWRSARGCRISPPAPGRCSADDARIIAHQRRPLRRHQAPGAAGGRRRARGGLAELGAGARRLAGAEPAGSQRAQATMREWNAHRRPAHRPTNAELPTYAQVVGAVNRAAPTRPTWRSPPPAACPASCARTGGSKAPGTFDCEFGFSCMGYEIAGGWGAKMADPSAT